MYSTQSDYLTSQNRSVLGQYLRIFSGYSYSIRDVKKVLISFNECAWKEIEEVLVYEISPMLIASATR